MKNLYVKALLCLSSLGIGALAQDPAPSPPDTNVRYRFIAPSVRPMNEYETDYKSWIFQEGDSSSISADDVEYTITGEGLEGSWHRIVYSRWVPHQGERLSAAGLTSSSGPITLSITGLPVGEHTLKAWHNSWEDLDATATLTISVDGDEVVSVSKQI